MLCKLIDHRNASRFTPQFRQLLAKSSVVIRQSAEQKEQLSFTQSVSSAEGVTITYTTNDQRNERVKDGQSCDDEKVAEVLIQNRVRHHGPSGQTVPRLTHLTQRHVIVWWRHLKSLFITVTGVDSSHGRRVPSVCLVL